MCLEENVYFFFFRWIFGLNVSCKMDQKDGLILCNKSVDRWTDGQANDNFSGAFTWK